MPLQENRRQQLDGIVQKMISNKESDDNIQLVVNDFTQKYEADSVPQSEVVSPFESIQPLPKKGFLGSNPDDSLYGKVIDNSVTRGIQSFFPGEKLGKIVGSTGRNVVQGVKNVATGKDFFQDNDVDFGGVTPGQALGDTAGAVTSVAGLKLPLAGGILKGAAKLAGVSAIAGGSGAAAEGGDLGDIFSSAMLSGTIGAGLGVAVGGISKGVSKVVGALTKKAPAKIYNSTIKNPLQDTKKAILYKGETLGEQLVKKGIKGSDESLFTQAIEKISSSEDKLQTILSKSNKTIARKEIEPYLDDLIGLKEATPGLLDDVEKIRNVLKEFPEEIPLSQANQIKRNLYNALDDVAFKIDPNLSTKKEAMKAMARGIKTEIENKTADEAGKGVVRSINQELQVFGALKNRTLDKIARANKNNLLGLGDIGALGTGAVLGMASGGSGVGGALVAETVKRASGSTRFMTNTAVRLNQLGEIIDNLPMDSTGKISKAALINLINSISRSQNKDQNRPQQ